MLFEFYLNFERTADLSPNQLPAGRTSKFAINASTHTFCTQIAMPSRTPRQQAADAMSQAFIINYVAQLLKQFFYSCSIQRHIYDTK
jgi:hypothetical protein